MTTTSVPAAEQVASLETSEAPSAESIAAARAALGAELGDKRAAIFEPAAARPRAADDLAGYQWNVDRFPHSAFTTKLLEMHRASLETSPGVASMCRTIEACEDVAERAAVTNRDPAAPAAARRAYELAIARQLCEGTDAPSAARDFLAAVDLEARLDALQARAEQHAAAEAARVAEAARAEVRARRESSAALIAGLAAAEQSARAALLTAVRDHAQGRARALGERIRESGLETIRDHLDRAWSAEDLLRMIDNPEPQFAPHELTMLERALARHEAAQEAA